MGIAWANLHLSRPWELVFLLFDGGTSPRILVTSASLVTMPLASSTSDTFSAKSCLTVSKYEPLSMLALLSG